jgi:acetolactate synthase-1/2/3 large subunit
VLALPEDMLRDAVDAAPGRRVEAVAAAPDPRDVTTAAALLAEAERPFVVVGGSRWDATAIRRLARFSETWDIPVGCSFRRQRLFDHLHPHYAGDVGLGINPALKARIAESDLLMLIGARFSENPSQGFTVLGAPTPGKTLVHVHPGPEELGRIYRPDVAICATPGGFLAAMADHAPLGEPTARSAAAHRDYRAWTDAPPESPGSVDMGAVIAHLRDVAPEAIIANGAGNYAIWAHRFWRYRDPESQLGPTSGSMGYGLPAAIAAKLRRPEREVICLAGDGCLQMTLQELGTAAQAGAAIRIIVVDNASYGTIRMHQERDYPGRVSATGLRNPDFAALARAYGLHAETVSQTAAFPEALERARGAAGPSLLHLLTDVEAITPTATLSAIRGAGRGAP